jgi:hypothetical protein
MDSVISAYGEMCQGFVDATKDGGGVIWDETIRGGGYRLLGT